MPNARLLEFRRVHWMLVFPLALPRRVPPRARTGGVASLSQTSGLWPRSDFLLPGAQALSVSLLCLCHHVAHFPEAEMEAEVGRTCLRPRGDS